MTEINPSIPEERLCGCGQRAVLEDVKLSISLESKSIPNIHSSSLVCGTCAMKLKEVIAASDARGLLLEPPANSSP